MITTTDIKILKKVFATKKDLERYATKEELNKTKVEIISTLSNEISDVLDVVGQLSEKMQINFENIFFTTTNS